MHSHVAWMLSNQQTNKSPERFRIRLTISAKAAVGIWF